MGKRIVKAAKYVVAVAAWLAAHTSFANEIDSGGGPAALSKSGASATAGALSASGASANGGAQTVNGGRTTFIGGAAAANNGTCMYPTAVGLWQNQEELCAILKEADVLTVRFGEKAGQKHLCQAYFMRETINAMNGPTFCDGVRLRNAPRAPHFRTDSWAEGDHWGQQ